VPTMKLIGKTNDNRPVFELVTAFVYKDIVIPVGFQTDLASVPRVPLAYLLCGNTASIPAIVHDYLYRKDAVPCLERKQCDQIFLEAMEETGEGWLRRKIMYRIVRLFGWGSYHKLKVSDKLI
jgi:hypothetical protein